jgi:pilus assembly protein CpaB
MNRRVLLIALAVVLALVGTGVIYAYVHNADKRAVDSTRAAQVLVAVHEVPAGTTWNDAVKGNYFEVQMVPVDSAPSLALSSTDASVPLDEVAAASIKSGEIVLRPMFAEKTSAIGVLPIPAKQLAVAFSINGPAAVAGFVQPQSEVAVFVTYKLAANAGAAKDNGAGGSATKLLFPRILVLATSNTSPTTLNHAGGGGGTVTLALTQQQAEQLILASQTSQLYLGLLSDTSVTNVDTGVTYNGKFVPINLAK